MPSAALPRSYSGTPNRYVLRRGTCVWRVHSSDRTPSSFNPKLADPHFGGARFDATPEDEFPYWYAAVEEETALCEVLLRDVCADDFGVRVIPRAAVSGKRLSGLALLADLTLVSLVSGADLSLIGQDRWLVHAVGSDYQGTRVWGHWLRSQADWAHGIIWTSLRNLGGRAIILFGDRCSAAFGADYEQAILHEIPQLTVGLETRTGAHFLQERLRDFGIGVAPPQ